jgi:hypothetical protein
VERLSLRFKGLTSEAALVFKGSKAPLVPPEGSSSLVAIVDHRKLLAEANAKEEALRTANLVKRGLIPQDGSRRDAQPKELASGKVNYGALLEQQREMAESCDVQRRIYHAMIKEYVKNTNLGDRFK